MQRARISTLLLVLMDIVAIGVHLYLPQGVDSPRRLHVSFMPSAPGERNQYSD